MTPLIQKLEAFFAHNSPSLIVNTSTNKALLCLKPRFESHAARGLIFIQFESLNERGGNSIFVKAIKGEEEGAIYVENEEENILMIQMLKPSNYRHYIQPQYVNAPDVTSYEELVALIHKQK